MFIFSKRSVPVSVRVEADAVDFGPCMGWRLVQWLQNADTQTRVQAASPQPRHYQQGLRQARTSPQVLFADGARQGG